MGLDGASWKILDRFIRLGIMPFLRELKEKSVWGILESVKPPVSAPAWVSFMTGCNPGKHGIGDFYKLSEDYKWIPQGFADIKIHPFWINITYHKIGVVNLPMTYPPPKVQGFIISGFMSPESVDSYTYPRELQREIEKIGEYKTDPYFNIASKNVRFLKKIIEVIDLREKIRLFLLEKYEPDLYIQIFQIPDALNHYFYSIVDDSHPKFSKKEWKEYGEFIVEIFRKIDEALKSWIEILNEDDLFIILSDHGFKPTRYYFNIVPFLKLKGFLKQETGNVRNFFMLVLRKIYKSKFFQKFLFSIFSKDLLFGIREKIEAGQKESFYKENKAVIVPPSSSYGLFIEGENDLRYKIMEELKNLKKDGKSVIKEIWEREKIYKGPFISSLPHIVFELEEGFELSTFLNAEEIFEEIPAVVGMGNHERNGVFLIYGKHVKKKGYIENKLFLEDFAPLILAYMGYKIPSYFDGNAPEFIEYPRKIEIIEKELPLKMPEKDYTDEEKESVLRKLKELGYA